ncbi:hypothetical protein D3C71_1426710 [compost metagenome]
MIQHAVAAHRVDSTFDHLAVGVQVQVRAAAEIDKLMTTLGGQQVVIEPGNDTRKAVLLRHIPERIAYADGLIVVAEFVRGNDLLTAAHQVPSSWWVLVDSCRCL